ncbi:MAG: AarF/UbiB family protein [Trebonia sp.]
MIPIRQEAAAQEAFAAAYSGDPDAFVPGVGAFSDHVLVSEWLDGIPIARIIAGGTTAQRNRAGTLITRFLFSGPARVRLLHADPHPGNFCLLAGGSRRGHSQPVPGQLLQPDPPRRPPPAGTAQPHRRLSLRGQPGQNRTDNVVARAVEGQHG